MGTKKYSSYAEIELELEILKVERELNIKRIGLNIQKTKEIFNPLNFVKGFFGDHKSMIANAAGKIISIIIPILINWMLKRKRGN
jgi:hypothetical protein